MVMICFNAIIFFLSVIKIAYTTGELLVSTSNFYNCDRSLSACKNDDNALFCYMDKIFTRYLSENKCDGYFQLGFCNHAEERLILQEHCPQTYNKYCNTQLYISHSSDPTMKYNETAAKNTEPDNNFKMYAKVKDYFGMNTCEKVLSLYGCGSTSKFVTATTIATFCPNKWIKTCEHVKIDDTTLPFDQSKKFLVAFTLDCKNTDSKEEVDFDKIRIQIRKSITEADSLKKSAEDIASASSKLQTSVEAIKSADVLKKQSEEYKSVTEKQLHDIKAEGTKYLENAEKTKQEALGLKKQAEHFESMSKANKETSNCMLNDTKALKKVALEYEKMSEALHINALDYSQQAENVKTNITKYLDILDKVKKETQQNKDAANLLKKETVTYKTEVENLQKKTISNINAQVPAIQQEFQDIKANCTAMQKDFQNLSSGYSSVLSKTQLITESSIAMKQDIQTINTSATTLQLGIKNLNASNKAAQDQIKSLHKENEENKITVTKLKLEIANLKILLKKLQQDIKDAQELKTESKKALKALEDTQAIITQIKLEHEKNQKAMDDLEVNAAKCCNPAVEGSTPRPDVIFVDGPTEPGSPIIGDNANNVVHGGDGMEDNFNVESSDIVPLAGDALAQNFDRSNGKLSVIMLGLLWIALKDLF